MLDTQSSCDIFNNEKLLENIKEEEGAGLKIYSNGNGEIQTNIMGVVRGYGKVWYHPESLVNIMSFANVHKKFKVQISTSPEDKQPSIAVTKSNGDMMHFKEIANGLYVYDASNDIKETKTKNTLKPNYRYSLISTTFENESKFTSREVQGARSARELYHKIGQPSKNLFFHILQNSLKRDCPVDEADAKRAFEMYGDDVASVKGKLKGPDLIQ